jgi:TP901 family phage tail tape measure protein
MAFDGTLKFDTAIDKTGFKLGLNSIGSIAKMGMGAITAAIGAATAGISALGAKAIESGKSFESGMSQIQATLGFSVADIANNVNGASETMEMLSQKAEEMGRKTAFSATQAAEGLNILAMSGYDAESSVGMIENVLSMASAGGLQLSQAASYVAGSMKGFTKEAEKFADVTEASAYYADVIAKGATMAATNVGQLGEALSQASATANTYGQTAQATEVALLRLAEQNETGSAAATALAAAMKNLYSPTDTAKKVLDDLGVSAYDAQGKARDFNEIVGELYNALQQIDDEGERNNLENAIFGIQGQAAFDKMVATSAEKVQSFYDGLEYTADGAKGSAAKQAEAMLDNLEGDITLLQSAAEGLYNSLYKSMNGTLRELVQLANGYVTELTEAFTNGSFEGLAQKAGDLFGDAITKISEYLPNIVEIGSSLVSSLLDGLTKNSGTIANTAIKIGLVLANGISNSFKTIPKFMTGLAKSIADGISQHQNGIRDALRNVIHSLTSSVTENIQPFTESILQIIADTLNIVTSNLPALQRAGTEILSILVQVISDNFETVINVGMSILKTLVQIIVDNLDTIIEAGLQLIQALCDALLNGENLEKLLDAGIKILWAVTNAIIDNLPLLVDIAVQLILFFTRELLKPDNIKKLLKAGVVIVLTLMNAIIDNLDEILIAAEDIVKVLCDELLTPENIDKLVTEGGKLLGEIINGLCQIGGKFGGFVWRIFEELDEAIYGEGAPDWESLGWEILEGIISGLTGTDFKIADYLDDFEDNWISGFKEIFEIHSPSKLMRDEVGKYLALGIGEGFRTNIPDVGEDALNAFRLQSADVFGTVRSSPTSEIVNNHYNYSTVNTMQNIPNPSTGDIIIPIYLEGEQIRTAVLSAVQIENLRSGGDFV